MIKWFTREQMQSPEPAHIPEYAITEEHWEFIRVARQAWQRAAIASNVKSPNPEETDYYLSIAKSHGCSIKNARLAVVDIDNHEIKTGHDDVDEEYAQQHGRNNPMNGRGFSIEFDDIYNEKTVRVMLFDSDSPGEKAWVEKYMDQCVQILKTSGYSYEYPVAAAMIQGDKQIY